MAKEVTVKIKVYNEEVEVTRQQLEKLNKEAHITQTEFSNATKALDGLEKAMKKTDKEAQDLNKTFKETKKEAKEVAKENGSLLDGLEAMPGATGRAVGGVRALGSQLSKLASNPYVLAIAAVIAAIYGIFKAWQSTKAGGEKWGQMLAGLGAMLDVVRDRVVLLGSAIIKVFTLDFKGAMDDASKAIGGFTQELIREFAVAASLEKTLQQIKDRERELNVERSRTQKLIADAKIIINDTTKSYGERIRALELVRQKEVELAKQEEATAKLKLDTLKLRASLSDTSAEQLDELAQAEIDYNNKATASFNIQKELGDQIIALKQQQVQAEINYKNTVTDLNTQLIEDDRERGIQELQNQINKEKQSIDLLQISEAKKQELKQLTELAGQKKITEFTEKFDADQAKKAEDFARQTELIRLSALEDGEEKQRKLLQNSYDTQLEDLQKSLDQELITQEQYDSRKLALEEQYQANLKVIKENAKEKEKEERQAGFEEQLRMLELEQTTLLDGSREYFDNLRSIEETLYQQRLDAAEGNAAEIELIQKQHAMNMTNIAQQQYMAEKAIQLERLAVIGSIGSSLQQIAGNNKKLAIAGIIIEKAASIGQIIANTGIANAKAVAASPLTGGMPWVAINSVAAGLSIGATIMAAQKAISEINNQGSSSGGNGPSAAQMAGDQGLTGRRYERGGMIGGRRHAQGGTLIEAEAGEAIINRNSVSMFQPLLSALNQMGGGVPLSQGVGGMASFDNPTVRNIPREREIQIIKSYVVESELTDQQQKQARLKELSTL